MDRNEFLGVVVVLKAVVVALLAEGVDRNEYHRRHGLSRLVALLAEGVDRNLDKFPEEEQEEVALLAEGVDRNWIIRTTLTRTSSRPPRGGRG